MSVTFSPEMNEDLAHVVTCFCGEFRTEEFASRKVAYERRGEFKTTCSDEYCDYLIVVPAVDEPEVQMANSNAAELLYVLGVEGEDFSDICVGSFTGEEFLGRVVMAIAVAPEDAGLVPVRSGNIIYGGREAGYVQSKLEGLREVAEWSIANNRRVVWG